MTLPRIVAAVALLSAAYVPATWAGKPVYESDFNRSRVEWVGRAGSGNSAPTVSYADHEKYEGAEVCSIMSDGGLGSGLSLKPEVEVEPGAEYKITFNLKTDTDKPVTFRITRGDDGTNEQFGEDTRQWFSTGAISGEWVKVETYFTAATTVIGVDIAVGADHDPAALKINQVKIEKTSK